MRVPKKTISALNGRTIRCFLFDCGDTLWTRNDKVTWHSLEHVANLHTVAVLRQQVAEQDLPIKDDEELGNEVRKAIEKLLGKVKRQHPGYEPDFTMVTLEALIHMGFPKFDKTIGEAVFEALRVRVPASRPLFPDTLSTLATLQERGFILGVVTNRQWGGQPFVEDLRAIGLLDFFDPNHMAISADLGVRKPNPAIFMHALNALRVTPQETAMVGDSLRADIAGANQLNIFSIWKPKQRLIAEVKAELPHNKPYLNNKYLLAYARKQEEKKNKPLPDSVKPNLTIEHLSDLLDVFLKVGKQ